MSESIFTPDEVVSLNIYQVTSEFHPFTQDWAYDFMKWR